MTLAANGITFGFVRDRPVLRDVSVTLRPGRLTVVLGPNGAGKSTLLRVLLGVLRPWHGAVTLDGAPLASIPRRLRAGRIAYISQRTSVAAAFTVEEVVRLGRFGAGRNCGAVRRALAEADLADRAAEPFGALSVGQQQRAAMAMALAQLDRAPEHATEPDPTGALLADEPVSAMDPLHALRTMRSLEGLARRGVAVCVVLHDFTAAARFADDALVLDGSGRVVAAGPAADTLTPDVLGGVFRIGFQRIEAPGGPMLAPDAPPPEAE